LGTIIAAATPTSTPYLYYLSDSNSVIHYAATFAEHVKNRTKYQEIVHEEESFLSAFPSAWIHLLSAALLQRDGYDVTGVFIKAWYPDFLTCTWKRSTYAMRVCAVLGIPF